MRHILARNGRLFGVAHFTAESAWSKVNVKIYTSGSAMPLDTKTKPIGQLNFNLARNQRPHVMTKGF
jgi:hypothetical protein